MADGESLVAVEAKGDSDLLKGIAQAELYRRGFHLVLLWPRWSPWCLALIALSFCYAIELSQLYKTPWLEALRGALPGRLVLGASFRWDDLLCYAVGVLLAATVDWYWFRAGGDRRSNGR